MELPAQAVPARLTNMAPVGDTWSSHATRHFTQLVAHRVVMARITGIGNSVSVCLCDTSGDDEDVHINDDLVRNGLAKQCRDEVVGAFSHSQSIRQQKLIECIQWMGGGTFQCIRCNKVTMKDGINKRWKGTR